MKTERILKIAAIVLVVCAALAGGRTRCYCEINEPIIRLCAGNNKLMKLYILSDIHVEFEPFDPPGIEYDLVILAGDIHLKNKGFLWAKEKFPDKPVIYVLGNHEYYGEALPKHLEKLKEQAQGTNINVLENEYLRIGDVSFLCCTLWSDFNLFGNPRIAGYEAAQVMTDYKKIRVSPTYRRLRSIDTAGIHFKSMIG